MMDRLERYKNIANSPQWADIKEALEEVVATIRDVANVEDLKQTTGYNVSLGSLFLGKLIASKKINDIISAIESLKDREDTVPTEDFE